MSELPPKPSSAWHDWLLHSAQQLDYPPTPDIASAVRLRLARPQRRARRLRVVLLLVLLLLALLAVPDVRAALRSWLRLGSVQIEVVPTLAARFEAELPTLRLTAQLGTRLTLAQAQAQAAFPIRWPTEPPDLGPPSAIYDLHAGGHGLLFVWQEPHNPQRIRATLTILDSDIWARKQIASEQLHAVTVDGAPALWLTGPHELAFFDPGSGMLIDQPQLVAGNVLIWIADGLTYRWETAADQAAALRSARSLAAPK